MSGLVRDRRSETVHLLGANQRATACGLPISAQPARCPTTEPGPARTSGLRPRRRQRPEAKRRDGRLGLQRRPQRVRAGAQALAGLATGRPPSQLVEVQRWLSGYGPLDERTLAAVEAIADVLFAAARQHGKRITDP
jgi:hypothetical protein